MQLRNLLILLMICGVFAGSTYAIESFQAEIEQLRTMDRVTGRTVYYSAEPGAFFVLSKVFLERGGEEDFLRLTADESPVVRSMGLLCLAQNAVRIQTLKEHLSDNGVILHFPLGCVGTRMTVGSFARRLLHDPSHLGHLGSHHSLLSENALIGLDIEILAKDSTTSFHHDAREALSKAFAEKRLALNLSCLKTRVPNLETYQIVKAVGRLGISPTIGRFLFSCVRDKRLDAESRLAAASALTRSKSERIARMIERHTAYLDNPKGRKWREHLLESARGRVSHEKLMKAIRAERTQRGPEGVRDKIIVAFSNSHPLILSDFNQVFWFVVGVQHDDDVCNVVKKSLMDMAKNANEFNLPWDTYSDTPYALWFQFGKEHLARVFSEAEQLELEKSVQKTIDNHFEGKSNRWSMR